MDSPIVMATLQAGVLSALSNILAQLLTSWRSGTPITLNTTDLFQFVLFAILSSPPNIIWQSWLEAQYPAYGNKLSTTEKEALVDEAVTGESKLKEKSVNGTLEREHMKNTAMLHNDPKNKGKNLNWKNTAIKFALDQTLGASVNTILFIGGMGLIKGHSLASIQLDVREQFWDMILAGSQMWPVISILNFSLVPLEYRMLVGNIAGVVWGIYLSLVVGGEK